MGEKCGPGSRRVEGTESGGVVCDNYTDLNGMKMWVKM